MNIEPGSDKKSPARAGASKRPARKASARVGAKRLQPVAARRITADQHRAMIAEAAYWRAERRNFAPGGEADDWYQAEAAIDAQLSELGIVVED
jgi:2-oxoglutarate dehydrogenase complex dehydrogenase (E1) component-like enzyme